MRYTLIINRLIIKYLVYLFNCERKYPLRYIAHNRKFDDKFLLKTIKKNYNDTEFKKCIMGITDSLELLEKNFSSLEKHKLTFLANKLLNIDENTLKSYAHDALFDVQLFEKIELKIETKQHIKKNLLDLKQLKNIISKGMLERLAQFNISYQSLYETFFTDGIDKTRTILKGEIINNIPSIIKRVDIENKIIKHFQSSLMEKICKNNCKKKLQKFLQYKL